MFDMTLPGVHPPQETTMTRLSLPVQFSSNQRCYQAGSAFGFALTLLVLATLAGYASLIV